MNAQPGWYDAGVPGAQRWWDGTQWTDHQRSVPQPSAVPQVQVQVQPQPQQQYAVQPQYAAPAAQHAPMGWFPVVGTADVRWWDGSGWTPHRIRDGKVRADAFAIEPANTGLVLGIMMIVLGVLQFGNYSITGEVGFAAAPVIFVIAGVFWLIGGIQVNQLKKLPEPSTVPVFDAITRPLPGEAEGPGAGWYPVSGQVSRWWTGSQWSPYVAQKFGVRPTQFGASAYRNAMIVGWVLVGLGVLGTVFGFIALAATGSFWSLIIAVPGVAFVIAGGLVLLLVYVRRYTLILPPQAPPLR